MIQFILLYASFYQYEQELDLSHLIHGESVFNQILYYFGLSMSFCSVCISFIRILKWGKDPVIESIFSTKFVKILLFIFSKFLVQGYILSMAFKNLLLFYVFLWHEDINGPWFAAGNNFYTGICKQR